MSRIDDALRRAGEQDRGRSPATSKLSPLQQVRPPKRRGIGLLLFLCLTLAGAVAVIWTFWDSIGRSPVPLAATTPNTASASQSARVPTPPAFGPMAPAIPTNPAAESITSTAPTVSPSAPATTPDPTPPEPVPPTGSSDRGEAAAPVLVDESPGPEVEAPPSKPKIKVSTDLVEQPAPGLASRAPKKAFPDLRLQSIIYRPRRPLAMINGVTVNAGDILEGVRVIAIERERVKLEWQGEERILVLLVR